MFGNTHSGDCFVRACVHVLRGHKHRCSTALSRNRKLRRFVLSKLAWPIHVGVSDPAIRSERYSLHSSCQLASAAQGCPSDTNSVTYRRSSHTSVERLDAPRLCGLPGSDEVEPHAALPSPRITLCPAKDAIAIQQGCLMKYLGACFDSRDAAPHLHKMRNRWGEEASNIRILL